ncbi:DUF4190 domain-containing protein [Kitasatospora brasiliensis]|uniref:DUF4190 domain-containing protein n=1 Tax=Kitasatospora brasiliensis TaxID=3058040 RepID=UPI00292D13A1|nr:DUF4190 domain-containing protein [Kitasatospora sp. K002]
MSTPESELPASAPEASTAGQDPRVDFRKDAVEPEPVEPEPVEPEPVEQPEPADPWAAPDVTAGPFAATPPPAAAPPPPVPPSAAPPQPPHPLPAGGWASVTTPAAQPGFHPANPYAPAPGQAPLPPFAAPGPAPTNGLAVGSLVTGLLLVAPVALVLGIVALTQINRRKQRGSGMAVAGVALGAAGTLLLAVLLGAADFSPARASGFGRPMKAPAGSVAWSDLRAGDCYDSPHSESAAGKDSSLASTWVQRRACTEPHHGEVAGTADLPNADGSYPGESAAGEASVRLCRKVLGDYALDLWDVPDGMEEVYLYPSAENWADGDRYVTCALEDGTDRHRGTVRTDRSRLTAPQLAYLEAARSFNDVYRDQPEGEVSEAEADYRMWARRMAAASRAEAAALGAPSVPWPADVQPKVAKLAEAKSESAAAWDAAASGGDVEGDLRRAGALKAKTGPMVLEVRRGLGLSTGEQAPDLRV